jgi:hypothetical protein
MLQTAPGAWSFTFLTGIERDMQKFTKSSSGTRFKGWSPVRHRIPEFLTKIAEAKTALTRLAPWYIIYKNESNEEWELEVINQHLGNGPVPAPTIQTPAIVSLLMSAWLVSMIEYVIYQCFKSLDSTFGSVVISFFC